MLLNPVSTLNSRGQGSEHSRVAKAAQDFEALLLTSLLAPLEKSFSAVPGESSSPAGSEDYGYMGVQALASALAGTGGIGIARLVLRQLKSTEVSQGGSANPGRIPTGTSGHI
jgi:Rod binding domain-containing protein